MLGRVGKGYQGHFIAGQALGISKRLHGRNTYGLFKKGIVGPILLAADTHTLMNVNGVITLACFDSQDGGGAGRFW